MKTKKVRPVLVEIKFNSIEEMQGDIILRNDKIYTCEQLNILQLHKKESNDKVFELILLSLESEKIEIGDKYLDDCGLIRESVTSDEDYWESRPDYKKVIARQSQIPSEYIFKFVEQYNNGCVEDLEIEMEKCWINSDNVKSNSFTEVAKFEPSINDFDAVLIIQPKLTNGFVTIVEKEVISYTEEEVRKLISEALYHFCPMNNHCEEDEIEWFEQNKKK